ncbi:MAG: TetR/AcrR family transcriptional regulator C-terminal domain-containing protein [Oscillospiraceae bacterium]|nr:TetR/AcrR family transcriptional regulator C-terminal domain-containing protein [Oscillospiraceae bacterium]
MKHDEQSLQTKQALSDALKTMMKKKPLTKITVRELVEDCGVNRKTFYYHFEDIFSLLKWTLEQEAICMFGKYDLVSQRREAVDFALDYIEANHVILHNIVHSIGRSELSRYFYNDINEPVFRMIDEAAKRHGLNVEENYKAFLGRFLTEAIAGILLDCIEKDALSDRESLSGYITRTLTASILGSLENTVSE